MRRKRNLALLFIALTLVTAYFTPDGSHAQATSDKFYQLDVVATIGQSGLTDIYSGPSINDQGAVAFAGKTIASAVFVSDGPGALRNITPTANATTFYGGTVQINNSKQVVTQHFVSGTSPAQNYLHIRDGNGVNPAVVAAAANGAGSFNDFAAIRPNPSLNNSGQVVFSGQEKVTFNNILVTGVRPTFNKTPMAQPIQPMIADGGNVVVRGGSTSTSPILLYNYNLTAPVTIASATDFSQLGSRPGISDDGRVVVFYGNLNATGATTHSTTAGPGIFASIDEGGATRRILRVSGLPAELGYDAAGAPIGFNPASYNAETRVAVSDFEVAPAGIAGNSFVVCFLGVPTVASPDNLYTNQNGVWTVRVDAAQNGTAIDYKIFGAKPVVQVGEVIGSRTVTGLGTYDPIANATTDAAGVARTMRRGDHKVVFWASTNSGNIIVRATYIDSDEDSLPDHWERNGVTFGGVFNNLPAMGADPMHKDLFVHADWMAPAATYAPKAAALQLVRDAFRNSPVTNPDTTTGINIHIDAGSASVMNPATGATWGTLSRAGQVAFQSSIITTNASGDFVWTDVDNIKVTHFNPAKRAPIFHYALFAHQYNSGTSSGLSRGIGALDFIVTLGSAPTPGGTDPQQAGTFMHELGHNLGLRHGGNDNVNYKPNYLSIMNYSFQFIGLITAAGTPEWNYSTHLLPPLNEGSLNEAAGISDPANHRTIWRDPSGIARQSGTGGIALPAIDWNWSHAVDAGPVTVDVNADGSLGTLTGFYDWPAVIFDGGGKVGTGAAGAAAAMPATSLTEPTINELIDAIPADLLALWDCSINEDVTVIPQEGGAPLAVYFDSSASVAPCGTIVDWDWDFGDGTTGSGQTVVHLYNSPGTYNAKLRLTDNNGHVNLVQFDHFVKVTSVSPMQSDISVTISPSPDPAQVNVPVTYTLTVSNAGPDTSVGVVVTDPLPAGVTFNSATSSQGTCSGTSTVTCDIGILSASASAQITISVTPVSTGTLINTATASSLTADPSPANNGATNNLTVGP